MAKKTDTNPKKRLPLVLRTKEGKKKDVFCDDHHESRATFLCLKCRHFFCEECVGGEDGEKTYCFHCKGFYVQDENQRQKSEWGVSSYRRAELTIAALMVGLILMLAVYVYQNSAPANLHVAVEKEVFTTEELAEDRRLLDEADRQLAETALEVERILHDEDVALDAPGSSDE